MAKKRTARPGEYLEIEIPPRLIKRLESYAARIHQSKETIVERAMRAAERRRGLVASR